MARTAISPTRDEDYPEWYQQVVKAADLAEHSPVRGCMVIKPWGYAIWERIQKILDLAIKETGCQNAYFPLFIPLSFFEKEAKHVEGFAKECAVVTHHRLEQDAEGKLHPAGKLDEPLIVRPTSEMIIGEMFSRWVQSYRDLPLKINQWANIVRWELRTRLFLRTTEFLWQEGHTVHATKSDAEATTMEMLNIYKKFMQEVLAVPVICGEKSEKERFPGADTTLCLEAMMQDRKALQAGTSHYLGQNFSKSSNIIFEDEKGEKVLAYTTSWGVTTRLIGALIMTHSDDDGLVLPPQVAPYHVVILPVMHKDANKEEILSYVEALKKDLQKVSYLGEPIRVMIDNRDMRGGEKKWSWVKKGVPLRIEVGPRDIEANQIPVSRRDKPFQESSFLSKEDLVAQIGNLLDEIQQSLLNKATDFRQKNLKEISSKDEFYKFFTPKNSEKPEIHAGFALCYFCEDPEIEKKIQEDLNVTVRCIPFEQDSEGICFYTGKKAKRKMVFAKSY